MKGVVIGGSSSLKPPQITEEMKGKGKGVTIEPTVEENKIALEKEMGKKDIFKAS